MRSKPKIFTRLDDEIISKLIMGAKKRIIYAGPAISEKIAEAITLVRIVVPNLSVKVVVDADPDVLRLGFGSYGGLKMLQNDGVEIKCSGELRISALIVDDSLLDLHANTRDYSRPTSERRG